MKELLEAYRIACRRAMWAETHGSHGDGRLEAARAAEKEAKATILKEVSQ